MLHAGLDLSRSRLDVCLLDQHGVVVQRITAPPDGDGLPGLARQVASFGAPVRAAVGSMNGARFVHDQLELTRWQVAIADAAKVTTGSTPACSPELSRRDLVPAIWLPTPAVRAGRERARFRVHLVRHRTSLKNRIHATLLAFGTPARSPTCSALLAGRCLPALACPRRGLGTWPPRWC